MQSPFCGIAQIPGNDLVFQTLLDAVNGGEHNFNRTVLGNYDLLRKACPLVIEFLVAEEIRVSNKIKLLRDLLKSLKAPFSNGQHI